METHPSHSTIFALASGAGRAGVSVFRLSGPLAGHVVETLTARATPAPRVATLRTFRGVDGEPIDSGLLLWMPSPESFTGEDVAEFHTHGSPAVIEAMGAAFHNAGAEQAGPGEFTRRAFENGRMDLTEAEGLADLIDAETEGQRKQALRQMRGGLRTVYEGWRETLIDALASIEGEIDFPDEADVPDALAHVAYAPLSTVIAGMQSALADSERGESVRAGIDIAIVGPPNAGKSTLLNRLSGRDAAIVSDIAGTTRDIIDVPLVIAGLPVRLSDTAGLRESGDIIETEGVRRATSRSLESDLRIGVMDASDRLLDQTWLSVMQEGDFLLANKTDTAGPKNLNVLEARNFQIFQVSAKTGEGIERFREALEADIISRFSVSQDAGLTRVRHRDCVSRAVEALMRAREALALAPELSGDDIRAALHAIKELAGEADIEAVLGRIFSRFCVGK